MILGFCFHCTW